MSNTQFQLANELRWAEDSTSAMTDNIVPEPVQFLELGYRQDSKSKVITDQSPGSKYGNNQVNNRFTISEALLCAAEFAKRDLDKATPTISFVEDRLPCEAVVDEFYQGNVDASILVHRPDGPRVLSEEPNWFEHTDRIVDLSGEPFDRWRSTIGRNRSEGIAYNFLADQSNTTTDLGLIERGTDASRAGIDQSLVARSSLVGEVHSNQSFNQTYSQAGTSYDSDRDETSNVQPQNSQDSHVLQNGYTANQTTPQNMEANRKVVPPVGSRKRKQRQPRKCLPLDDPTFRGATVIIKTMKYKGDYRLEMSAYYSGINVKRREQKRPRIPPMSPSSDSQSEDELPPAELPRRSQIYGKQCASCGTRKTPLWRDAEDGTPLCNACGIRYKKYRTRCLHCWMIPRKETKPTGRCAKCGTMLKAQWQAQRSKLW